MLLYTLRCNVDCYLQCLQRIICCFGKKLSIVMNASSSVSAEMQLKENLVPLTWSLAWLRLHSWQLLNPQCLWSNVCCWELTLGDYWCDPNFLCLLWIWKGQRSKWGVDNSVLTSSLCSWSLWCLRQRTDWQPHQNTGKCAQIVFLSKKDDLFEAAI